MLSTVVLSFYPLQNVPQNNCYQLCFIRHIVHRSSYYLLELQIYSDALISGIVDRKIVLDKKFVMDKIFFINILSGRSQFICYPKDTDYITPSD